MNPAVLVYRMGNFLYRKRVPLLPSLVSYFNRVIFGCWLPSSASVGRDFKLGYWGIGIVIHSNAVIGDNCLISQNVTLGRNKKDSGIPKLGNSVYVAPGVVIAGAVEIGDNVIVGANSFVNKNVPSGVVVAGVPAKVIRNIRDGEIEAILP